MADYKVTSYYTAAELDDSTNLGQEFVDLTRYGITSSLVSGGVGIVNSFGALANAFGADYQETTTAEALESFGMEATAAYARENATGVEFAGLIAGSIVPGALGIKAIKAAQAGLSSYNGSMKAVTGIRAAVVPKNQVRAVEKGLQDGTHSLTGQFKYTLNAARQGFHQQVVEAAAAETAILLTMNQHSTLNDADLGYFDSIKENLGSAAVGLLIGGGIGGTIATFENRNGMYNAIRNVFGDVRAQADVTLSSADVAVNKGDALAMGIDRIQQIKSTIENAVSGKLELNKTVVTEMRKTVDYLSSKVDEAVNQLVDVNYSAFNPEYAGHVKDRLKSIWRNMPNGEAANTFAGAKEVRAFNQQDTLFGPNIQSYELYDDVNSIAKMMADNNKVDYDKLTPEAKAKWDNAAQKQWLTTYGFAYIQRNNAEVKAAILNQEGRSLEEKIFTLRHEVGHLKGASLARVFDTTYGQVAKTNLVQISRKARPAMWANHDKAVASIPELRKQLKAAIDSGDTVGRGSLHRRINFMEEQIKYANDIDELLADSIALFDNPKQYELLTREFPGISKILTGNSALRSRLGQLDVYMDLQNQNMFKQVDREPTIADLGTVELIGKSVIYGAAKDKVSIAAPFDPLKATATEASAYYYAAFKQPFTKAQKEVTLEANDLPSFNKVIFGLKQRGDGEQFAGKVKVNDGAVVKEFDFTDSTRVASELERFRTFALQKKAEVASIIRKRNSSQEGAKNIVQETELARLLDTDVEWSSLSQVQRINPKMSASGNPFWSETYRPDQPTLVKVRYDSRQSADPMVVKSQQDIAERINAQYRAAATEIQGFVGTALKDANISFLPPASITSVNRMKSVDPTDETQGFLTAAQGDYGTASEFANNVGTRVTAPMKLAGHKSIDDVVLPSARMLIADQSALAELATLDSKLRQAKYKEMPLVFNKEGGVNAWFYDMFKANTNPKAKTNTADERFRATELLRKKIQDYAKQTGSAKLWQLDIERQITDLALTNKFSIASVKDIENVIDARMLNVGNAKVAEFMRAKATAGKLVVEGSKLAAKLKGKDVSWDSNAWYPGRLDRSRYKNIVFVHSNKPGLFGESKYGIVGAPDKEILEAKLTQLKQQFGDDIGVITADANALRHKELLDDYDSGHNIDEYYMDYGNKNAGVAWDLMPDPTPQLVQHMLDDLKRQWSGVTDQLVSSHYAEEFAALDGLEDMRKFYAPSFGQKEDDPSVYTDYMSTMLNKPNDKRFKNWRAAQQSADKVFSAVWNTVAGGIRELRGKATTADYQEMNTLAEKYGLPQVYSESVKEYIVRTEAVSDSVLADIVPQMNWFGATAMLRLDYIQPIVNSVSMPILAVPEIKHLVDALPKLRAEQLRNSLTTAAVDAEGNVLAKDFSNTKLMMQAVNNWYKRPDLREAYKQQGLITEKGSQYFAAIDQASLVSKSIVEKSFDGAKEIANKAADLLAKPTDWSEDFTRFLAADMARQVLEAGGIGGTTLELAQRTYVNRVIGNYHYAQRPAMFQGFAGQAIGLFQTYQFNLTQQLLRHMGDKPSRALALMGIQSATFGLQSTPGFELLNQHVYERSNYEGDFYTGLKNTIGQEPMEWVMYGMASNFSRPIFGDGLDLFSRGNLTPRSATVVPTSLEDLVVVNMATKAIGAFGQAMDNIAGGVPVSDTIYQAMATNGINRPIQGIGQLLAGERTTAQGSMLLNTSDLDWFQSTARVMGARGLNEAVAVSNYYRAVKFETARNESIESDGKIVKQAIMAGSFDGDSYAEFMKSYTQKGGDIDYYDRWVNNLYKSASQSQIYDMYNKHDKPEGRYMQQVMGAGIEEYINPFNVTEVEQSQ